MDANYIKQIDDCTKRIDKILNDDYGFKHVDRDICGDWYPHPHVYTTKGKQTPIMCGIGLIKGIDIDIVIDGDDGVIIDNAGDHLGVDSTYIPKDCICDIQFYYPDQGWK